MQNSSAFGDMCAPLNLERISEAAESTEGGDVSCAFDAYEEDVMRLDFVWSAVWHNGYHRDGTALPRDEVCAFAFQPVADDAHWGLQVLQVFEHALIVAYVVFRARVGDD